MGDSAEIRARAATWRDAARQSRERAHRVGALGTLRWDAPAADAFRQRLLERAAGLHGLAELEDSVGDALEQVAVAIEDAEGVLADLGRAHRAGGRRAGRSGR